MTLEVVHRPTVAEPQSTPAQTPIAGTSRAPARDTPGTSRGRAHADAVSRETHPTAPRAPDGTRAAPRAPAPRAARASRVHEAPPALASARPIDVGQGLRRVSVGGTGRNDVSGIDAARPGERPTTTDATPALRANASLPVAELARRILGANNAAEDLRTAVRDGTALPAPSSAPILESFAARPSGYLMGIDQDPTTHEYVLRMAAVGAREGFAVVVMGTAEDLPALRAQAEREGHTNLRFVETHAGHPWTEDALRIRADGVVVGLPPIIARDSQRRAVPPGVTSELGNPEVFWAASVQTVERIRRLHPEAQVAPPETVADLQALRARYPDVAYHLQFSANAGLPMAAGIAYAEAAQTRFEIGMAYVEGGNVVLGQNAAGEPIAIVGADTVALNAAYLGDGASPEHARERAVRAIAHDLGLPPERVVVMEQPGDFHIDMSVLLWEPGVAVLNDARQALALQEAELRRQHESARPRVPGRGAPREAVQAYSTAVMVWRQAGRELESSIAKLAAATEQRARGEDRARLDLERAGLRVERAAARFLSPSDPGVDAMNFVNGEAARGASGRYFVTASGEPWAEQAFVAVMARFSREPTNLYFGPSREAAAARLANLGSLNCMAVRIP